MKGAPKKRVLYISGSVFLGHVTRDLAIARELRRQDPNVELFWIASPPADRLLAEAGENILPEARLYAEESALTESVACGFQLNIIKALFRLRSPWKRNVELFKRVMHKYPFDLVVGDETYEIAIAFRKKQLHIKPTFVMIFDFIGVDAMTANPLEKAAAYRTNSGWSRGYMLLPDSVMTILFVGQPEDIPDKKFGFLLPNRRAWARRRCKFLGYVLSFDPQEFADCEKTKARLGYGKAPLVVCAVGGSALGRGLLDLCAQAYVHMSQQIRDLRMVLVCGPRLAPESLNVPAGIEVRGYVPALYEHFAACDLAIVQGGGTSTLELTALRRPFIYFPLEGHFEQQIHVAGRLERHQAGVKLRFSETTPQSLAKEALAHIGKKVTYPPIRTDGARRAAQLISALLPPP